MNENDTANIAEEKESSTAGKEKIEKKEETLKKSPDLKDVKNEESTSPTEEVVDQDVTIKKSKLMELEKELQDFKERFYYIAAEKENSLKRFEREKENLIKFGNEKVLSSLLAVVDNLDLTLNAIKDETDEKIKNIFVGIEMVNQQFSEALKANGLEVIKSVGEKFDPNLHEALMQKESEDDSEGTVLEEVQRGYILNGRVLRAAKVIISK